MPTIVILFILAIISAIPVFAEADSTELLQLKETPWSHLVITLQNGNKITVKRPDIVRIQYVNQDNHTGASNIPVSGAQFLPIFTSGREFSGEARQGSKTWPFKIKVVNYNNSTGAFNGEISWSSLSSIHRIRGVIKGKTLTFTEVEALRRGSAHLNVSYSLTASAQDAQGTWLDQGDRSTGTIVIHNH